MDTRRVTRPAPERAPKTEDACTHDELLEAAEEALAWMRGFDRDAPAGLPAFEREAEVRVQLRTAIRKARRDQTVSCDCCGERFPHREITEVQEDDGLLSWFVGDRICSSCIRAGQWA